MGTEDANALSRFIDHCMSTSETTDNFFQRGVKIFCVSVAALQVDMMHIWL